MALVTFSVYRTVIVDGVATGDSELVEITIDDADDSGSITRDEWEAYTGDPAGHIGGSVDGAPALWDGDTGALNGGAAGFLYTTTPLTAGTDVVSILSSIVHAPKYDVSIAQITVCFVAGTLIATPDGEKPVESLQVGDMVLTRDHGPQPLVWTAQGVIEEARLDLDPSLRPVRIAAGALGADLPRQPVCVSAQHRVMITDDRGEEVLVAARHLKTAGMPGFEIITDHKPFTLVHIACAHHEIIQAEGAAMETFFPGPMAVRALPMADRLRLEAVFPSLKDGRNPLQPARPFLKKRHVVALLKDMAPQDLFPAPDRSLHQTMVM